tara:strand:- start:476 stop:997 length:522 start_codon:yes stop_codon:yes gene_type:complete
MDKLLSKYLPLISFISIPIILLWHPNWVGILGYQPYWPLFWLLPWSMIHGSFKGSIGGLFLGLVLDAIFAPNNFTQIPGLILCGFWFGRISICSNVLLGHFRHGLICSIGSFVCSSIYFFQILVRNFPENNFSFYLPSLKNVLFEVFLTGLLAPLICSQLLRFFKSSKEKYGS